MKKISALLVFLCMSLGLYAAPAFADTKIGVLNMKVLLQELPQMKQIGADLKKQFGDRQKTIANQQKDFKLAVKKFRRDSALLTDKDKQAAEDKLLKQSQKLRKEQTDFQRDYMAVQNKEVSALMKQIKESVKVVAEQEKFDLIIVNNSVAYNKSNMDVTSAVLKQQQKHAGTH